MSLVHQVGLDPEVNQVKLVQLDHKDQEAKWDHKDLGVNLDKEESLAQLEHPVIVCACLHT